MSVEAVKKGVLGCWSNIIDSDLEQMDKLFCSLSSSFRSSSSKFKIEQDGTDEIVTPSIQINFYKAI